MVKFLNDILVPYDNIPEDVREELIKRSEMLYGITFADNDHPKYECMCNYLDEICGKYIARREKL